MWLDADDALRGGEKLRETIEKNKEVDAFIFDYLYAFDEYKNPIVVHPKTRVLRNDNSVVWEGALHEDFRNTRGVVSKLVEGIEVLHMSKEERFEEAKKRNLVVAKGQLKNEPNDPRSYWNVGNSLKALGKNKEAIKMFDKFIEMSQSDDEKYIVYLRMAESYWAMGEKNKAIDKAKFAIGTKPQFPDAYHLLGSLYMEMKQLEKARDSYLQGLTKRPPYHAIVVYNPRDYDYVPMMNLAKVYYRLSLPTMALPLLEGCAQIMPEEKGIKDKIKLMKRECKRFDKMTKIIKKLENEKDDDKLKAKLEALDDDMKSHPAVCLLKNKRFIKKESSGKDLVLYCGYTEREWTPETAKKEGIGGSEEAIIWLAQGLSKKGWNVTVYNNCGHKEKKFGNVLYKPYWTYNIRDKQDVTVFWRSPSMLDYDINCDRLYLDLHDVIQPGELNEKRMAKCAGIFVKSEFHRELFPNVPNEKFIIIPNGIDVDEFKGKHKKEKGLIINTSSPDRGMRAATDLWPDIKKKVKNARFQWAYGWGVWDVVYADNPAITEWKDTLKKDMKTNGVEELGMVSHKEVAEMYKKAEVLFYPSEFAEIDCISLSKAMAAGCIPVTTDFAAMGSKKKKPGVFVKSTKNNQNWCKPYQFDFSAEDLTLKYTLQEAVVDILKGDYDVEEMRKWALETFDWNNIISGWDNEFNKKI
jgi:tetratricopeptide (TPR) repeat protein